MGIWWVAKWEKRMYVMGVLLLLLVCPAVSVAIEAMRLHEPLMSVALIGRWWTFWAVGVRLLIAGVRQVVQPKFTAEGIFGIHDDRALPLVREVGFGNLSMGTVGICSLFLRDWAVPAAAVGGLYYGLAGLGHVFSKNKNAKEYTAMLTDGFAFAVLGVFVVKVLM